MSLNVGELYGTISLDTRKFDSGVARAQGRLTGLGSSMARTAGNMTAALGRAALLGVTALGGMAVAGGVMGVKVAAGNEQAMIGFTTMLGSAKKAGAFLKDLQSFAAKTPFEFPELQTAASSLISAGIEANKIIPIMTTLGNATSGMGTGSEGVKRATVALQQMNAAGKITGEDLNQLRDAGIPVYDLLATATGKSKAKIAELAAAGKLGKKELDAMMGALASGKGLERFNGLMAKQSVSLTGLWSTLKDTVGQGLATAITPLIPMIKDGLGGATAFLSTLMPKLATSLKTVIGFITKTAIPAVRNFVTEFQSGAGAGGTLRSVLERVAAAFVITVVVVKSIVGFLRDHNTTTKVAATVVGLLVLAVQAHNVALFISSGRLKAWIAQTLIVRTATATWAAIQWVLNSALISNPIGIVVMAVAALVGAVILIATKTTWFQTVWQYMTSSLATAWRWLWNSVLAPIIRFVLNGFATITDGIASMLRVLSYLPNFGWAKVAADKMSGAADKAHALANNIKDVKSPAPITIKTLGYAATYQQLMKLQSTIRGINGTPVRIATGAGGQGGITRAGGGPVRAGMPYIVGDGGRPEWFVPDQNGTIIPRVPSVPKVRGLADQTAPAAMGGFGRAGQAGLAGLAIEGTLDLGNGLVGMLRGVVKSELDDRGAKVKYLYG